MASGVSHAAGLRHRAGGGIVVDVDGNPLIDFGSGIAVTSVGNSADRGSRPGQRAGRALHPHLLHGHAVRGVRRGLRAAQRADARHHDKRSALFNSGAEAVENAVKIARHATGRQAVVAFDHAYHGRTNLTMALTAKNMPYKHGFGPFAPEVYRVPMAYPFRWPTGPQNCADEALEEFVSLIHTQVGEDNIGRGDHRADPGRGRVHRAAARLPAGLAEFCREHGIVFIADEIQTGFCRTGDWFACDHEGVVPDLITTAKGIAGGLPLAAVTGRAEIMDAVHAGGLGGTYGGNPVACAAALGAIETMRADDLPAAARRIGEIMLPRLRSWPRTSRRSATSAAAAR